MTPRRFDSAFQPSFLALFEFLFHPSHKKADNLYRINRVFCIVASGVPIANQHKGWTLCEAMSVTGLDYAFGKKERNRPPLSLTDIHIWLCFSFYWHISRRFVQLGIQFQSNLS